MPHKRKPRTDVLRFVESELFEDEHQRLKGVRIDAGTPSHPRTCSTRSNSHRMLKPFSVVQAEEEYRRQNRDVRAALKKFRDQGLFEEKKDIIVFAGWRIRKRAS